MVPNVAEWWMWAGVFALVGALVFVDLFLLGGRSAHRVTVDGHEVELTPTEFSILEMLMRYKGQVVTRSMLCEHIWGFRWDGPTNVIEVHITRIRGKLDHNREKSLIRTIRGRGYALAADAP